MATVTHVLSGAGEPLDPPPSIGAHYVNTNNGALYLAKGIASGADWVKLGSGGGSAPSEVLHVNTDGQFLLEPQHSFVEARLFAIRARHGRNWNRSQHIPTVRPEYQDRGSERAATADQSYVR